MKIVKFTSLALEDLFLKQQWEKHKVTEGLDPGDYLVDVKFIPDTRIVEFYFNDGKEEITRTIIERIKI
jgi:sucrose-6-phosphate hydrolase SacC (GH32 family)